VRILFCRSSLPGYEQSTASHFCTVAWKLGPKCLEVTGSGQVKYFSLSISRRVKFLVNTALLEKCIYVYMTIFESRVTMLLCFYLHWCVILDSV